MNIQKRYIDEATEMIDSWYEAIDQYDNMVNELAAALARIANEAAWDGWDLGSRSMGHHLDGDPDESSNIYDRLISKYGPRPEAK